ncbi:hypothetical protein TOI97_04645 [Denitrificimonas sp. JX-1]|uniref:DUF4878 domain-containing protein n=1 Tax=Denitrificimonas halotolerans TaxID=3098930 RepID=A0ABU5GPI6_9GAMM|nr:hypothetical protein [Denitrificimonas sp. JX-1]MDY7218858.1 hypothetical protein [Denitrificimonas sp. JX-1]
MKQFKKLTTFGIILSVATILTACSDGAPSETEVRKVLEDQMKVDLGQLDKDNTGIGQMVNNMLPKFNNISLQGCESGSNDIYTCSVEATVTMFGQEKTSMENIRLKKNKEGQWRLVH